MEKREQLYEGKAKKVFATDDPTLVIVSYKDDATAFNGAKKGTIAGKGVVNNKVTNYLMRQLEEAGVPTHFVRELNDRETVVKKVAIVPLEVTIRDARSAAAEFSGFYGAADGRIDIPSGKGREGAVKYTDYAIGRFLAEARQKPWFDKTVFVFVADHTAGSAGKEDLPVANYHIPLFIHAPSVLPPREVATVASQIDLAPTLLGLLNFDYTSTFFGRNVMTEYPGRGRALVGNYQHLGLFDGTDLAILSPRKAVRRHEDALGNSREVVADTSDALVRRNVAYFQGASHDFRKGLLAWRPDNDAAMRLTEAALMAYPVANRSSGG